MKEFRCSKCDKLLGMIEGKAEIKCPKCKTLNKTKTLETFEEAMLSEKTIKKIRESMELTNLEIKNIHNQLNNK